MGEIYEFLGLTVGVIVQDRSDEERQNAYAADVTYGLITNLALITCAII